MLRVPTMSLDYDPTESLPEQAVEIDDGILAHRGEPPLVLLIDIRDDGIT
jgi:hypothetical protein